MSVHENVAMIAFVPRGPVDTATVGRDTVTPGLRVHGADVRDVGRHCCDPSHAESHGARIRTFSNIDSPTRRTQRSKSSSKLHPSPAVRCRSSRQYTRNNGYADFVWNPQNLMP